MPTSLPQILATSIPVNYRRKRKETARQVLTGAGLAEIITYSLCSQAALDKTGLGELKAARVQNPLSQEQELMRPALLPAFLAVLLLNGNRGNRDLKVFELGKIYLPTGEERETLGFLLAGSADNSWRAAQKRAVDFYDIKGIAQRVLAKLDVGDLEYAAPASGLFVDGEAAVIKHNGKEIGFIGRIHKDILRNWDIKHTEAVYGQIDLEAVYARPKTVKAFTAIASYPAVTRDISLAVTSGTSFAQIRSLAQATGGELLREIDFRELYLGDKLPAGTRGYVLSLTYQSTSRTLTEDEVNKTHAAICSAVVDKLKAVIR